MQKDERYVRSILALADVIVDGTRPWDITVTDSRFYGRVLSGGALGLGESFMDGWWDCADLEDFIFHILTADLEHKIYPITLVYMAVRARLLNLQSRRRAARDVGSHYDRGNDFFRRMLDPTMTYSCAYWKNANSLEEAQQQKLRLVCDKIGLQPGMTVLDIGCGWGSFLAYAARERGASCTGITLSTEQASLGRELCSGLPVDIQVLDYRDIHGMFDRIVSLGMIEHVGPKNYRRFMETVHRSLADEGLFLLHTIGANTEKTGAADPWMDKYIFPAGVLPTAGQLARAAEGLFVMEDWHNFGTDYSKTARAWFDNVDAHWNEIRSAQYDDRFYRMWKYFLHSQSGAFRARRNQLWQIVFSKRGVAGGYVSLR